jgi:hypothetical protein
LQGELTDERPSAASLLQLYHALPLASGKTAVWCELRLLLSMQHAKVTQNMFMLVYAATRHAQLVMGPVGEANGV